MDINDVEFIDYLNQLVKNIAKKEIAEAKLPKVYPAKVVAINGDLIDVKKAENENILTGFKNKSHEVLIVGDNVYLFSPTGNLTNAWVMEKF